GEIVAAGLGAGRDGVGSEALPARHAGVDAVLQRVRAEVGAHVPARHRDVDGRVRAQAEAAQAAPGDRAQIGLFQPVPAYHRVAGGVDVFGCIRNGHV